MLLNNTELKNEIINSYNKYFTKNSYGWFGKKSIGDELSYKVEGFMYDYDSYAATSSSANSHTVSADLDVTGAKFAIGYNF